MSNYKRLLVVCEGQTEQNFINQILSPEFSNVLDIRGVLVGRRGGDLNFDRVERYLQRLLKTDSEAFVSTFFDLYCLPNNFPGFTESASKQDIYERCRFLERKIKEKILDEDRFFPHIQPHEFEALIFSDINQLLLLEKEWDRDRYQKELLEIKQAFDSPEHINSEKSPSHRIIDVLMLSNRRYRKPFHGIRAIKKIELPFLAKECSHFSSWLDKVKELAKL